jgi:hypothetical protein
MSELDVKNVVLFTKKCLRDEGYSKELIAYLLSTYDLPQWIKDNGKNKLEIASGFLAHARHIQHYASNY